MIVLKHVPVPGFEGKLLILVVQNKPMHSHLFKASDIIINVLKQIIKKYCFVRNLTVLLLLYESSIILQTPINSGKKYGKC